MMVRHLPVAALGFVIAVSAAGQTSAPASPELAPQQPQLSVSLPTSALLPVEFPPPGASQTALGPVAQLLDFKDSDIKFNLSKLMSVLRGHEGWVLTAYPDPNTARPLIGAGFSLDLPEREHSQQDPLNPHLFLEPSSAQLWQAAGLEPERLQRILDEFESRGWSKRTYLRKIRAHALTPDITEEDATKLLRIAAIQAVYNAKAYCRYFDRLSGPQQMALSQLVYQMGVNLEEFVHFLNTVNDDGTQEDADHWKDVQHSLMSSQWARRYSVRATKVIAMFNPDYLEAPNAAEREVALTLHPPSKHHHGRHAGRVVRVANHKHLAKRPGKRLHGSQSKRKLT